MTILSTNKEWNLIVAAKLCLERKEDEATIFLSVLVIISCGVFPSAVVVRVKVDVILLQASHSNLSSFIKCGTSPSNIAQG